MAAILVFATPIWWHVIGNVSDFFNALGVVLPPYGTLSVLWERQAKGADPTKQELLQKYESDYADAADKMVGQMVKFAEYGEA